MKDVQVLAVGDLILDIPEVERCFDETKDILHGGDVVIGQVEVPHTSRPIWSVFSTHGAPAAPPENLDSMKYAGFNVATMAGNHCFDQGMYGITDAIERLQSLGIATTGSGANIYEARKPAVIEAEGGRIACFSYNCVGPRESWASPLKAGCAFIRVTTAYGSTNFDDPGALPAELYTVADPGNLQLMKEDFEKARAEGCRIVVSFHSGRMVFPELVEVQRTITHFAIDNGAEAVFCHHPHTLQGVELYKGRPIFYSLGNFVTLTNAFIGSAKEEKQHNFRPFAYPGVTPTNIVGFVPEKGCDPRYIFDTVSRKTVIAKAVLTPDGKTRASMYPCLIEESGHPVPLTRANGGEDVLDHIKALNTIELLDVSFEWNEDGTEITIV